MSNFRPGYLEQGAPLGATRQNVHLSADSQVILLDDTSAVYLTSDNTTATNRTFTLRDGSIFGHKVTFFFESGSSYTCDLQVSGNFKGTSAWQPLQYDTLTVMWDGTYWVEIGRGFTGSGGTNAIAADTVTVADMTAAVMKEVTGTLTQAQLLALSTPVVVIAAGGAGTCHIVDEVELLHTYSTAAYATGSDVSLEYTTSGDNICLIVDSFVTAGASANAVIKPSTYDLDGSTGTGSGFNVTSNANKGVQFTSSNFTDGNAANIIKYRIRYHTVTLLT